MPIHDLQSSFAGGEISPDLIGRVDLARYKTAVKSLKNFIVSPRGPIYNRPGTTFVGAAKYNDRKARVIPFIFSQDQAYILEFGDEYIRFFRDGGEILEDVDSSVIPFWNTNETYSLDTYVLHVHVDFSYHLYKSLKYSNIAKNPETEPTYWDEITTVTEWSAVATYSVNNYVYRIRPSDGKRKLFFSLENGNINNDPVNPTNFWIETSPAVWSATITYEIGDFVSFTDFDGNVAIYRSMRASNTNHDIFSEPLWWQFWNGPLTWDVGDTYAEGDFVIRTEPGPFGIIRCFQSTEDANIGHDPLTSGTIFWEAFDSPAIYEIVSPYDQADLATLKYVQSADTLYLVHDNYAPQTLVRNGDNDWTLEDYAFENGPFMLANSDEDRELFVTLVGSDYFLNTTGAPAFHLFVEEHVGALWQLNYSLPSQLSASNFSSTQASTPIRCGGSWRLITSGTWNGLLTLQRSDDGGVLWQPIATFNSNGDLNFNTFGEEDPGTIGDPDKDNFLIRVNYTHTSGSLKVSLTRDAFNHQAIVRVTDFILPAQVGIEVLTEVITIDTVASWGGIGAENLVILWAEGSWSNYRGWPGTVTFCQDRLIFGGTDAEPQTEWMTKASDYTDFGRSDPLVDSDGITINLLSRQINRIRNLVSFLNSLLSLTGSSEFSTSASDGGVLTPTSVLTKVQGFHGSSAVEPTMIGNHVLYISSLGSTMRDITFDLVSDSFNSEDIGLYASHLFQDNEIVDMTYQQEPDSLVWLVRDDGTLLSLTYMREQEMLAWSKHETDGLFESITTIPGENFNELWFIVKRGTMRFIERMTNRTTSTDPADQYFVDCGLSYDGAPVTSLTGLDHLNGLDVAVNAEGFILPEVEVADGAIALGTARSKVHAGLPYVADVETLRPNVQFKDGPNQGRRYRIERVVIGFVNSRGGFIGSDSDTLDQEIDERDESLEDETPTPLFSGFSDNVLPAGEDPRGHVMYRQTDPMPVTITSILSILEPGQYP